MTAQRSADRRLLFGAAALVLVLAAGSTLAVAAMSGEFDRNSSDRPGPYGEISVANRATPCAVPVLPGSTVDAALIDMGAMMHRGGMMRGSQTEWRHWHPGMMRIVATPQSVPRGAVSLRVTNRGVVNHELLVMPLAKDQVIGSRTVKDDGEVDEAVSLGEVSQNCATGEGDEIPPGSTGWITLRLPVGRYELICNLPGHYGAGMYTELNVS